MERRKRLASRFRGRDADHYFTFLTRPGVEPTNNLTEQAIRHVVIDRRVTQGTRGEARNALVRAGLDSYSNLCPTRAASFSIPARRDSPLHLATCSLPAVINL